MVRIEVRRALGLGLRLLGLVERDEIVRLTIKVIEVS